MRPMAAGRVTRARNALNEEWVLWFLAFTLAIVGHMAAHDAVSCIGGHHSDTSLWTIPLFATFTITFYLIYRNPLAERAPGARKWRVLLRQGWPWILGSLAGISTYGVAASFTEVLSHEPSRWGYPIGYLVATVLIGRLMYASRSDLLTAHTRDLTLVDITGQADSSRHHIVWLLSTVAADKGVRLVDGVPDFLPACPNGSRAIRDDWELLKSADARWNWEMLTRGILPHVTWNSSPVVTLVCSADTARKNGTVQQGSIRQAAWAAAMLKRYKEFGRVKVRVWALLANGGAARPLDPTDPRLSDPAQSNGVAFNEFDGLSIALSDLLRHLKEHDGAPAESITIDITGGQKPASLVAGSITFRGESKTQYVDTGDEKRVFEYDVKTDPEPKGA